MIGVAVIGAGNWGRNLVRNFASMPRVALKYVCDVREPVRLAMASAHPQAKAVEDLAAVLGDEDVDAVVVAVDAPRHHEVAKAALEAGKHVYVEKPMTLSAETSIELATIADERGLTLMVGHLLEYHPAVNFMKEKLHAGDLGDPLYLYSQRVNLGIVRKTENAWWSLAPHDISVACYLYEAEPKVVSASGHAYLQEGIEDVVFANLKFEDGRMAHIHVSWLDPHKVRRITLVGSQKMIVFDDMEAAEKVRIHDKGADVRRSVESYAEAIALRTGDILIPRIPGGEPLRMECRHFVDAVSNGQSPRSDAADGVRVVRVLEAGAESLRRGGEPVRLD